MASENAQSSLVSVLENMAIPWVERDGMANIFTAYPKWHAGMELPDGMTVTHKPLRGKRVPARGARAYGNTSVIEAHWPEDNLHSTRTPKLIFILSFPATLQIADYVVHGRHGHGILVLPGIPFADKTDSTLQNQEMLQLMPYHDGLICWHTRRWLDAAGKSHVKEQSCSIPHSQVTFFVKQLAEEAVKNVPHQRLVCDSLLKITLALLLREVQLLPILHTGEINTADVYSTGQTTYSIKEAQEYIERNLREPLSIKKVARHVCMSRTMFTAQFRAKTGKSFSRYLQDLRFEEACKLLRGGDLGIHHIAAAVGLKSTRLRDLFHEREGVPPLEYRRRSRLEDEK